MAPDVVYLKECQVAFFGDAQSSEMPTSKELAALTERCQADCQTVALCYTLNSSRAEAVVRYCALVAKVQAHTGWVVRPIEPEFNSGSSIESTPFGIFLLLILEKPGVTPGFTVEERAQIIDLASTLTREVAFFCQ